MNGALRTARLLSGIILVLAVLQAATGLLVPSQYQDNALVRAAWRGNDWITLAIAIPVLAAAAVMATRGSRRAELIWLGMLDYMLYNYAFYLFGAAFNAQFLVYAALFAASMYALIAALIGIGQRGLSYVRAHTLTSRWAAAYLLATAVLLGALWSGLSVAYLFTGKIPGPVAETGHPTAVVFALDLTLLVPPLVLSAVWLWRGRAWGTVLGIMLSVKGFVYTLSLSLSTHFAVRAGFEHAGAQLPLWLVLSVGSLCSSIALLRLVPRTATAQPPMAAPSGKVVEGSQ